MKKFTFTEKRFTLLIGFSFIILPNITHLHGMNLFIALGILSWLLISLLTKKTDEQTGK